MSEKYPARGRLETVDSFESTHVKARRVDVWLPRIYDERPDERFPVLYMHDGQNLFYDELSFSGVAWDVHRTLTRLSDEEGIRPAIVVAIWNTHQRITEYMPQRPMEVYAPEKRRTRFRETYGGDPTSDAYLRFVVDEVKSDIDARYRTRTSSDDTVIMGSSMGGLISLYAMCEYPDVFGAAGCLSTSWTIAGQVMLNYLAASLPRLDQHQIYFDYGVEAQIGHYESLQRSANLLLIHGGRVRGRDWMTERFPGTPHSESAWRDRVDVPLRFFFG